MRKNVYQAKSSQAWAIAPKPADLGRLSEEMLNRVLNSGISSEFPAGRWLRVIWCGSHMAKRSVFGELLVANPVVGRGTWGDFAPNVPRASTRARVLSTAASLWLTFVIAHPSQFSIWVALLLAQWYTAAVTGGRSWQFARFKGKKPNFKRIRDFPFIPLEGDPSRSFSPVPLD